MELTGTANFPVDRSHVVSDVVIAGGANDWSSALTEITALRPVYFYVAGQIDDGGLRVTAMSYNAGTNKYSLTLASPVAGSANPVTANLYFGFYPNGTPMFGAGKSGLVTRADVDRLAKAHDDLVGRSPIRVSAGIDKTIYLALRADGRDGDGSESSPRDVGSGTPGVGSATKLDLILREAYLAGTSNLMWVFNSPGIFDTTGSKSYNNALGYYWLPSWHARGLGMDFTEIRHLGAMPAEWTSAVGSGQKHMIWEADSASAADDISIQDLRMNANWPAIFAACGYTNRAVDCIGFNGSRIKIKRVRVRHTYGNVASLQESFAIILGTAVVGGVALDQFECAIEDCEGMEYDGDYGGAFHVFDYGAGGLYPAHTDNLAVRRCTVRDWVANGSTMNAPLIEDCFTYGCNSPVRADTFNNPNNRNVIRRGQFFNIVGGVGVQLIPLLGSYNAKNITIEGMLFELGTGGAAVGLSGGGHVCESAVVKNNEFRRMSGATNVRAMTLQGVQGARIGRNYNPHNLPVIVDDVTLVIGGVPQVNKNVVFELV